MNQHDAIVDLLGMFFCGNDETPHGETLDQMADALIENGVFVLTVDSLSAVLDGIGLWEQKIAADGEIMMAQRSKPDLAAALIEALGKEDERA